MFQNREKSGKHLIADIRDVKANFNFESIRRFMEFICYDFGFNILQQVYHKFDGDDRAFTLLFLLSDSHFSVHTYPERNTIALDLYTCKEYDDDLDYLMIVEHLQQFFKTTIVYQIIDREF